MVEGLVALMNSEKNITGPINLGNPQENTILELAEKVIGLVGSETKLVLRDLPTDDPKQRCPDISKARDILNWEPEINWEEGLKRTIDDFRKRLDRQ